MEEDIEQVKEFIHKTAIYYIGMPSALTNILNELDRLKKENRQIKTRIHYKVTKYQRKLKNNISNLKRLILEAKMGTLKDVLYEEYYPNDNKHKVSLEHLMEVKNKLLMENKKLKEENEELKKGINTLMNKRKKWKNRYYKLKKENEELKKRQIYLVNERRELEKIAFESNENYISKQVIRDKIDELTKEISKLENKGLWNEPFDTIKRNRFVNYINILKELLGE